MLVLFKQVKFLLKNLSGEAQPGRLLAIMGPSGSGKTMLLDVLAGQLAASPQLHLSGLLEFNGKPSSNKTYKYDSLACNFHLMQLSQNFGCNLFKKSDSVFSF